MAISVLTSCVYPGKPSETSDPAVIVSLTIDPLIGIALLIIASLALNGNISMGKGGTYATLILGVFEVSFALTLLLNIGAATASIRLRAAC